MLIVSFQISNIPQTPINEKEIELHDTIKDIIKSSMNDVSFTMQTGTTLKFENYWDLNLEENEIINNDYKRKAVEF